MDSSLEIRGRGIQGILDEIEKLSSIDVMVGIPEGNADRSLPITNASLGYIHENGAPRANIPARPWLVPGVIGAEESIIKYFRKAANSALDGDSTEAVENLSFAGIAASDSAKEMINSNIQPALSELTLARRRARGVTRTNTLVDTGELRNSVNWVLRRKS